MTFLRRLTIPCMVLLAFIGLAGCDTTPEWPASTEWSSYTHPRLGYTVDIPAACGTEDAGESVLFRHQGQPILCVNYVTPEEGKRRGLWSGKEAVGEVEVAGRTGKKYVYEHGDGPMWMNVVSYVIPYKGRELGIEFRMRGEELGEVQKHVLESFTLAE